MVNTDKSVEEALLSDINFSSSNSLKDLMFIGPFIIVIAEE